MWKITDEKPEGYDNFLMLRRDLISDLLNGKITLEEFFVLLWLSLLANPLNGKFHISYQALVSDLKKLFVPYKNKKNKANKIMLALLQKNYVWFQKHKGSRTSFEGVIDKYPLSSGKFIDVSGWSKENDSRSKKEISAELRQNNGRIAAEVKINQQKLQKEKNSIIKGFSMPKEDSSGRSANNYNNNYKIIDKRKFLRKSKIDPSFNQLIPVNTFSPHSWEEERCLEIAKSLRETDMRFILNALKRYGLNLIERAWGIFREIPTEKIHNPRKYFNKLLRSLGESNN